MYVNDEELIQDFHLVLEQILSSEKQRDKQIL